VSQGGGIVSYGVRTARLYNTLKLVRRKEREDREAGDFFNSDVFFSSVILLVIVV